MSAVLSTVSTLVVCWNNREFLGRCLESVPAGSDLVVVDNASSDGSADIVQSNTSDQYTGLSHCSLVKVRGRPEPRWGAGI